MSMMSMMSRQKKSVANTNEIGNESFEFWIDIIDIIDMFI